MATLKGGPELRARLKAIRGVFKPLGREWADRTADEARRRVPVRAGNLRRSIRRRNATQRRATVVAHLSAFFVDSGAKPHEIEAKRKPRLIFEAGGRTIFAPRVSHPGQRAQPFRADSARAGLRGADPADLIRKLWNQAA